MLYRVTVSSPGTEAKNYEVEAPSVQIAASTATGRFMRDSPAISQFDLSVVVHDRGAGAPRAI